MQVKAKQAGALTWQGFAYSMECTQLKCVLNRNQHKVYVAHGTQH